MVSFVSLLALVLAFLAAGVALGRLVARRRAELALASTNKWLESIRGSGASECAEIRRGASLTAREEAEMAGAAFDAVSLVRETELSGREAQLEARRKTILRLEGEVVAQHKRAARAAARAARWTVAWRMSIGAKLPNPPSMATLPPA